MYFQILFRENLLVIQNYCRQMRCLCYEWFQNVFVVGAPPRTFIIIIIIIIIKFIKFNLAGYSAPSNPLACGEGARCPFLNPPALKSVLPMHSVLTTGL